MLECEALDEAGALQVRVGEARYPARLVEPTPALFVGQILRVAMQLSLPTATRPGGEVVAVVARVVAVRSSLGWSSEERVPLLRGLEFRIEALRTSLGALSEDGEAVEADAPAPVALPLLPGAAPVASVEEAAPFGEEPTGVVGNLREMQLSEIVQMLTNGLKDAVVELKPKGAAPGVVFVERGQVVFARMGSLEGPDAFFALLPRDAGMFRIRYGRTPPARNIEADTTFLLLEAARRADEESAPRDAAGRPIDGERSAEASGPLAASLALPETFGAGDAGAGASAGDWEPSALGGFSFVKAIALSTPGVHLVEDALEATAVDLIEKLDAPEPDLVFAAAAEPSPPPRAHPATSPFMRFFDEAGIEPVPPSSLQGDHSLFTSLRIAISDDPDDLDTQVTTRVRKGRPARTSSDPPGP